MKKLSLSFLRYFLSWLVYVVGYLLAKILNRIDGFGVEHVLTSRKGVCILSHHKTIADPWWQCVVMVNPIKMLFYQKRLPYSIADNKNFAPNFFLKYFFKLNRVVLVKRKSLNKEIIQKQVDVYRDVLKKHNLLLYFEGKRSRNGEVQKCEYGPAKLVLLEYEKVKFIPAYLDEGVEKIMPIKEGKIFTRLHFFKKAKIFFGPEIIFTDIMSKYYLSEKTKIAFIKKRIEDSVKKLKVI